MVGRPDAFFGCSVSSVARQVGKTRKIIAKWGERFVKKRIGGLRDKPAPGKKPAPGRVQ
jgi:transposase